MKMRDKKYLETLGQMQRPIPGQSLTNDPDRPLPFEGPPEFVRKKDALEYIFERMIDEEVYPKMIENIGNGIPIMDQTQMVLFSGFTQGKWNPDMMVMLMEPTAYMMMALAERVGVDYVIDREPDEEANADDDLKRRDSKLQRLKAKVTGKTPQADSVPEEIKEKIDSVPLPEAASMVQPRSVQMEEEMAGPPVEQMEEPPAEVPQGMIPRRG